MLPTPDLGHLKTSEYEHVYKPAEDTFIFLDALEEDADELRAANARVCLELGSGSGCVSALIAKIIGPSCLYLCSDINKQAALATFATGQKNDVSLEPVITSLTDSLDCRIRLSGGIDVLLFNPPYVPTDPDEADEAQESAGIQGSWAGGPTGMDITNKVLDKLEFVLSPKGRFYLVAVKQNNVPEMRERMKGKGFESKIVLQRRAGGEYLYIIRFLRST